MATKKILMIGNDALREKSEPVDLAEDDIAPFIQDLRDTLYDFQNKKQIGRAIAGPQIGYLKRIIYMEAKEKKIVMINPHITQKSEETFEVWDSCFSADVAFFGKTVRNKSITVDYINGKKEQVREKFTDDLSELFQHEIDHLDGVLFTDRIIDNQIIMRSEWEKLCQV